MTDEAPGTELAVIRETMRREPDAYWSDEGMQHRFANLLEAEQTGAPAPARSEVDEQIARYRQMIAVQDSPYWDGPNAAALQAEFAELLARRDGQQARAAPAPGSLPANVPLAGNPKSRGHPSRGGRFPATGRSGGLHRQP